MPPEQSPDEQANHDGWTLWTVMRRPERPVPAAETDEAVEQLAAAVQAIGETGVVVRGLYDVSGLRADADLMVWLHGGTPEGLQAAARTLRRTRLFASTTPVWNALGVHREAEFNRAHVPGFLRGEKPRRWLCLYPFVRSYDWYVIDENDRRRMLAEHGRKGAAFTSVVANTVSTFALSDYEWLLPLEADDLVDLVDLMRDLRATEARLHVREETPFFTGRRLRFDEVPEVLR